MPTFLFGRLEMLDARVFRRQLTLYNQARPAQNTDSHPSSDFSSIHAVPQALARQAPGSPAPYSPSPFSPSSGSPGTGSGAGAGSSGGGNPQPVDTSKPLFTEPNDITTNTAVTTIVPPEGIIPVKYVITLTFDDGRVFTFKVLTGRDGIGNVNLHTLEPCTTYTLSSVAVLPDGTTMEGGNFATLTTLTV
jgi:hypothetical protein